MRSSPEPSMTVSDMTGYIHSVESFGTVDGPGVRYVVFFAGCPMRCRYCHNPDTWKLEAGQPETVDSLLAGMLRNRAFYESGGLTATGGEPLLQLPFLTALFSAAKAQGISTCLDTSGVLFRPEQATEYAALLAVTDLVLLDIKHMDAAAHLELTGQPQKPVLEFLDFLRTQGTPVWIRHVIVPGITDAPAEWEALGNLLRDYPNVEQVEPLPYHTMGTVKYKALGLPYSLEGVPPLEKSVAEEARRVIEGQINA